MLKIAIDKNPLVSGHKVRGVGRYTKELITSLKKVAKAEIVFRAVDFSRANFSKYDVVHVPFFNPIVSKLPEKNLEGIIVTIHDLIPLIYPEVYQAGLSGKLNFRKQKKLLKKVGGIITPSETSKKDVVRLLDISEKKVWVVYEAHRAYFTKVRDENELERVRKKFRLPQKFVLYVGDVNYNKNIPSLVEACGNLDVKLVICGKQALDVDDFGLDLVNLKGPRDWVRFLFNKPHPEISHHGLLGEQFRNNRGVKRLGFVNDRDLLGIYNLASVYVQPSHYEGFGLSVLEAMSSGTPVVVSRTNALVEVSGGAAMVADPLNPKDIAKNISKILKDIRLKNRLVKRGFARSLGFSWNRAAKETIEVYKAIINS